jgi:hypothetical protein
VLSFTGSTSQLSQVLAVTIGKSYELQYFIRRQAAGAGCVITVSLGGITVDTLALDVGPYDYFPQQIPGIVATAAMETLVFQITCPAQYEASAFIEIDSITLTSM